MLSGCIVEDPPPYTQPTQTPPRLDLRLAEPPPDRVIIAEKGQTINFRLPFASEDAGETVTAFMFVDIWPLPLADLEVPGSTLDDTTRAFDLLYDARPQPIDVDFGCHRILVRVSHTPNFRITPPGSVIDEADVADAYWWLNIIDVAAGDDGSIQRNCPSDPFQVPAR